MNNNFTDSKWEQEVLQSDKPVLVDFWAEWCPSCIGMEPMLDQLEASYQGRAILGKLNVDENPNIASTYGIRGLPTILVFKGGQVVDRIVGVCTQQTLSKKMEALV